MTLSKEKFDVISVLFFTQILQWGTVTSFYLRLLEGQAAWLEDLIELLNNFGDPFH